MTARIDLTGQRFGRWVVVRHAALGRWHCVCDCGGYYDVDGGSLRAGRSTSCIGCRPADHKRTHGQSKTRLYRVWEAMKRRCSVPTDTAWERYGGRGITVCAAWVDSFETFQTWAMANGYTDELTIDRRDNDGNYDPENCRWATYAEQNRNYSRNRPIEYQGRSILAPDLAKEVGIPADILKNRIFRYGWSVEKAVTTPVAKREKREPWKCEGLSRSEYYRRRAAK